MRTLGLALFFLVAGLAGGYLFRGAREAPPPARVSAAARPPVHDAVPAATEAHAPLRDGPSSEAAPAPQGGETGESSANEPPGKPEAARDERSLSAILKKSLPLIELSAKREAEDEAQEIARLLELPPHRVAQLEQAFVDEAQRVIREVFAPALEGEEPDLAKLAESAAAAETLSPELERSLSAVLNTTELESVRTHMRERRERRVQEAIDAQVAALAVPDLTEEQEQRLRALFREPSRHDDDAAALGFLSGEFDADAYADRLAREHARRRERMSEFLTPTQLAHVEERQRRELEEQKLAMELFGGMLAVGASVEVDIAERQADEKDG